jgi:hypothetical protein
MNDEAHKFSSQLTMTVGGNSYLVTNKPMKYTEGMFDAQHDTNTDDYIQTFHFFSNYYQC